MPHQRIKNAAEAAHYSNQCRKIRRLNAALKGQKVERRRLGAGNNRAAGVGLAAVVGLVVEEVRQEVGEGLLVGFSRHGAIGDRAREGWRVVGVNQRDQAGVLGQAGAGEGGAVLEQDGVKPVGGVARAGQPVQPDAIGDQKMVEGAVQAAEKDPCRPAIGVLGQGEGGGVNPRVGPFVVSGELAEQG